MYSDGWHSEGKLPARCVEGSVILGQPTGLLVRSRVVVEEKYETR